MEDEKEEAVLEPKQAKDKAEPVEDKVLAAVADKAGRRRVLMGCASVRYAGIPSLMSAACHARRLCARSVARPCAAAESWTEIMKKPLVSETTNTKPERLHWRGLTSLVVTLAFLALATTGVIMYVSPQGRVANWTDWNVLGLSKQQWIAVHTTMALLFVIAAGFHAYFNWQSLVRYIVLERRLHLKREMVGAAAVVTFVFAGTVFEIPPFSSIIALNGHAKGRWAHQNSTPANFNESRVSETVSQEHYAGPGKGHGAGLGRQTIQSLCESNSLSLEKAVGVLQQQGFTAKAESTLKALAEQKGMTPAEVRDLLIKKCK